MENKLTEQLQDVTITDVKVKRSIHNQYFDSNEPTTGKGKDNEPEINLENIQLAENNPDLLKQRAENDLLAAAKRDAEIIRLAEEERLKNEGQETPEAKLEREKLEREKLEAEANKVILDAEGNQVDAEGKIIKTKDVLATEAQALLDAQNISLIEELITTAGVEILDENGTPKIYEDSAEGIIAYANDLAQVKLIQSQKDLFKAYPNVEKYLKAQIDGVPDEEFFGNKLTDWKNVTIDETNEAQQLNVIAKELESRGLDKVRVAKAVARIKDGGKDVVLEESNASLKSLQDNQIAVEKTKAENHQLYIQQEKQKADAYWNKVEETITKGKIGEYIIPEADRKAFNDYVSLAADEDGNSAAMIARSKQTLEQKLLLDYYSFKGMKFDTLAKIAVDNKNVKSLRDRIAKNNTSGKIDKVEGQQTINLNDIKLENIQH